MKVRDVIKAMENDGWVIDRTRGDHRQYQHPGRPEAPATPETTCLWER